MTNQTGIGGTASASAQRRSLTCSECGTEFGCDLSGNCWCMDESAKLPMPVQGGDCLCRDCLRKAAAAHARANAT